MLHFQCPCCTGVFQVEPSLAGQQVACPNCQAVVAIEPASTASLSPIACDSQESSEPALPTTETSASSTIPVAADPLLGCPRCSGTFQVTAEMAGQQMACPHCGGVVTIPGLASAETNGADAPPIVTIRGEADAMMAFRVREVNKKIIMGDRIVEVRRLTPDEKARRRLVKRIVLIGFCTITLIATMLYLNYVGLPK